MEDQAERVLELPQQNEAGRLRREDLEAEYGSVEETLSWCLEHDSHRGLEIAAHLGVFWRMTGRFEAGRRWLQKLLSATAAQAGDSVQARAHSTASVLAFRQGDTEEARRLAVEALTIARDIDDPECVVSALGRLMRVSLRKEDPEGVRRLSEEGRAVARKAGRRDLEKMPLHCLAEATRMAGDYAGARHLYEESISLNRELDDQRMITVEMNNLASVELHDSNLDRAAALWQEFLRRAFDDHDLYLVPYGVMGLGEVAAGAGHYERAARLLGAATGIFDSTGQQIDPADRRAYEQSVNAVRQHLDAQVFETLWSQGAGLSVDQAVEAALAAEKSTA